VLVGRVQYHRDASRTARILIDAGGVVGNRIDPPYEWVDVRLHDARDDAPTWERDRVVFTGAPAVDLEALPEYEPRLRSLIAAQLEAEEVVVFDHTVRGPGAGARPPSHHVHCDYNAWSARTRMQTLLGSRASSWADNEFAIVNVWRPIVETVHRDPIGFVLPRSVDPDDWLDVDIVFPDRKGQVRGLRHAPDHHWVTLPDMTPDQAAIFATYASAGIDGVAHAAVDLVDAPKDAPPRRSLESRAFVRWGSRTRRFNRV